VSAEPLRVLVRGCVVAPFAGGLSGLLVALVLAAAGASGDPRAVTAVPGVLGVGLLLGGAVGAAVGAPSAVVLAVLSPTLRTTAAAVLSSAAVSATSAALAVRLVSGGWEGSVWMAVPCGIVGAVVGRWVVLGSRRAA
jgi:hypothetical protein